ncbi:hypothetical protein CDD80_6954 [Ophiocordyceps camponoti-rufipedis]|uniref:DUF1479 domain protein n=1 Tax=Ophiocordyceps camponoti-rufipedis TaxID=2004952 RepID=A0A2C5ZBJ2_9HYPO|nr:hypothetical protein CDD80_6954 [Ophiocordyceps camponoti-rufipedis]
MQTMMPALGDGSRARMPPSSKRRPPSPSSTTTSCSSESPAKEAPPPSSFWSGPEPVPLPPRFARIKRSLVAGHEADVQASWRRLLTALRNEVDHIEGLGPHLIPSIEFSDVDDAAQTRRFGRDVRRYGVGIVRKVLPRSAAQQAVSDTVGYLEARAGSSTARPGRFRGPRQDPWCFDCFWTPAQVRCRAHPNVLKAQRFVMGLWETGGDERLTTRLPVSYVDRVRVRGGGFDGVVAEGTIVGEVGSEESEESEASSSGSFAREERNNSGNNNNRSSSSSSSSNNKNNSMNKTKSNMVNNNTINTINTINSNNNNNNNNNNSTPDDDPPFVQNPHKRKHHHHHHHHHHQQQLLAADNWISALQSSAGVIAQVDNGSLERWEPDGYGRCGTYSRIFAGDWENYDPWHSSSRVGATTDLYNGYGSCSILRMFQGLLSLSTAEPGMLRLLPSPRLATAYYLLRPFFSPRRPPPRPDVARPGPEWDAYLDPDNWLLQPEPDTIIHGAVPGHAQRLTERWHPHLHLRSSLVTLPTLQPGDYILWHPDLAYHFSDPSAGAGGPTGPDRPVTMLLYVPAAPLTQTNALYLARQRKAFRRGHPGPDFDTLGRGIVAEDPDLRPGEEEIARVGGVDALRAMGLAPWEPEPASAVVDLANLILFPE